MNMNIAVLIPIIAIMATAWVIVSFLNYRAGRRAGGLADAGEARENARLERENELLRRNVDRLEERIAVLERIATDPAERTAREIEALR